jgi:hypothetical protein
MERPDRTCPKDWSERATDIFVMLVISVFVWWACAWIGGTPGECFIAASLAIHAVEIKDKIRRGFTRTW